MREVQEDAEPVLDGVEAGDVECIRAAGVCAGASEVGVREADQGDEVFCVQQAV